MNPALHYFLYHLLLFILDRMISFFANEASEAFVQVLHEGYHFRSGIHQEYYVLKMHTVKQHLSFTRWFQKRYLIRRSAMLDYVPTILSHFCPTPWLENAVQGRK